MSAWIPCTGWNRLEGGREEAERLRSQHDEEDRLLEIVNIQDEWFFRYSVRFTPEVGK